MYYFLHAGAVLLLMFGTLRAQSTPDSTLPVDLKGVGTKRGAQFYSVRGTDELQQYSAAWITVDGEEVWRLDSNSWPYIIQFAVVQVRLDDRHQQILASTIHENDWMSHWLVSWTGERNQVAKIDAWGPITWNGDGSLTSLDWLGFCTARRIWQFNAMTGAVTLAPVDQHTVMPPVDVRTRAQLTLTTERGSGRRIVVKKRSRLMIDAIDTRNVNTDLDPAYHTAWLHIRTSDGKSGWARVEAVDRVAQLPWAG